MSRRVRADRSNPASHSRACRGKPMLISRWPRHRRTLCKAMLAAATARLCGACAPAPTSSGVSVDPAVVATLAPTGTLRASINLGNPVLASLDPATGQAVGVSVDLATELAGRLHGLCPDGCEFPCCGRDYPFLTQSHLPNEFHRFTRLAMTTPSPSCDASFCVSRRSPMQRGHPHIAPGGICVPSLGPCVSSPPQ
jgi:hypothetical protein